jgi:hypothetical protein
MSIQADIKQIGPSTFMAVLAIRNRWWHCNGTMTYSRRIRAICRPAHNHSKRLRRWRRHWLDRPQHAQPGSYEFARRAHMEMERVALRRPKGFF